MFMHDFSNSLIVDLTIQETQPQLAGQNVYLKAT